jgi:hypothetical protein
MQKAEQFRQYAEEAMRWAYQSKSQKSKEALTVISPDRSLPRSRWCRPTRPH